jgi:hypothetical protein
VEGLADIQNDIKATADDLDAMRKKTRNITICMHTATVLT